MFTHKITTTLRGKDGASLVFVLGVMLLIMSIGASTLAAAGANTGFNLRQRQYSNIMLLNDSVHRNIMYSLQHDPADEGLLSYQLAMAAYQANDPELSDNYRDGGLQNIELDMDIGGIDLEDVPTITLSFAEQNVRIPAGRPMGTVPPSFIRQPRTAEISLRMYVTVKIERDGYSFASKAAYIYSGELSDDPNGVYDHITTPYPLDSDGNPIVLDMKFSDYGRWRLERYEKIEPLSD
ncbi:MAG: hypothetical protein FWH14_02290 [Oscillospiraceae bacterium]|nr:hypothetical protein [Oscillospiraceae bacterium]